MFRRHPRRRPPVWPEARCADPRAQHPGHRHARAAISALGTFHQPQKYINSHSTVSTRTGSVRRGTGLHIQFLKAANFPLLYTRRNSHGADWVTGIFYFTLCRPPNEGLRPPNVCRYGRHVMEEKKTLTARGREEVQTLPGASIPGHRPRASSTSAVTAHEPWAIHRRFPRQTISRSSRTRRSSFSVRVLGATWGCHKPETSA